LKNGRRSPESLFALQMSSIRLQNVNHTDAPGHNRIAQLARLGVSDRFHEEAPRGARRSRDQSTSCGCAGRSPGVPAVTLTAEVVTRGILRAYGDIASLAGRCGPDRDRVRSAYQRFGRGRLVHVAGGAYSNF
jgi:hypothetical protein